MSFINSLLLDRVAYGFAADSNWLTTRAALVSGRVRRNSEWSEPKQTYVAAYSNIPAEHRSLVIAAFNACRGSGHSFRFFDRQDYLLDDVIIGTATGVANQQIQLIKPYGFGSEVVNRTITKPVDAAVDYGRGEEVLGAAPAYIITANNTPISYTLNYLTGIVTLTATEGHSIRATGWFDVPVYFEHDKLSFAIADKNAHTTDIELTEDPWA